MHFGYSQIRLSRCLYFGILLLCTSNLGCAKKSPSFVDVPAKELSASCIIHAEERRSIDLTVGQIEKLQKLVKSGIKVVPKKGQERLVPYEVNPEAQIYVMTGYSRGAGVTLLKPNFIHVGEHWMQVDQQAFNAFMETCAEAFYKDERSPE